MPWHVRTFSTHVKSGPTIETKWHHRMRKLFWPHVSMSVPILVIARLWSARKTMELWAISILTRQKMAIPRKIKSWRSESRDIPFGSRTIKLGSCSRWKIRQFNGEVHTMIGESYNYPWCPQGIPMRGPYRSRSINQMDSKPIIPFRIFPVLRTGHCWFLTCCLLPHTATSHVASFLGIPSPDHRRALQRPPHSFGRL